MSRYSRITPWFRGKLSVPLWDATLLSEVDARFVPPLLLDLEARKTPALSENEEDFAQDYDSLCKQQEALLMGIGDRLISEVRALRFGNLTPVQDQDPALDPYTLDLPTIASVAFALSDQQSSVLDELRAIKAAIEAGEGGEAILEKLDVLILLLGA